MQAAWVPPGSQQTPRSGDTKKYAAAPRTFAIGLPDPLTAPSHPYATENEPMQEKNVSRCDFFRLTPKYRAPTLQFRFDHGEIND